MVLQASIRNEVDRGTNDALELLSKRRQREETKVVRKPHKEIEVAVWTVVAASHRAEDHRVGYPVVA